MNPLVPWVLIGGLIMAIGTLIAMWPGRGEEPRAPAAAAGRAAAPRPREREPELVEA